MIEFKNVSLTVGACESDDAYPAQGQSPETVSHVHSPGNYETPADRTLAICVGRGKPRGEERRDGRGRGKEWERRGPSLFRIIRGGLTFSRTRLGPGAGSRFSTHRPRKRSFTSRISLPIMRKPEDSPEWALAKTRERCSPCEHARDTDGIREWRESLNRQQTQTAAIDQWRRSGLNIATRNDFVQF